MDKNSTLSFTSGLMTNSKFLWTPKTCETHWSKNSFKRSSHRTWNIFTAITRFSATGTSMAPNQRTVSVCLQFVSVPAPVSALCGLKLCRYFISMLHPSFCWLVCLWMRVQCTSTRVGRFQKKTCLSCSITFCLIPLRQDLPLKPEVRWQSASDPSNPRVVDLLPSPVQMLQMCINPC